MPAPTAAMRPLRPRTGPRARGAPRSVKQLLERRGVLSQLSRELPIQQSWIEWLRASLSAELAPHVLSALSKPAGTACVTSELVVFADSAAWCTRLRYALAGLQQPIGARAGAAVRISVRVMVQSAAAAR